MLAQFTDSSPTKALMTRKRVKSHTMQCTVVEPLCERLVPHMNDTQWLCLSCFNVTDCTEYKCKMRGLCAGTRSWVVGEASAREYTLRRTMGRAEYEAREEVMHRWPDAYSRGAPLCEFSWVQVLRMMNEN